MLAAVDPKPPIDEGGGLARDGSLARCARAWAIDLTRQPSVTGTADEAAFGPWLAERLSATAALKDRSTVWTFPVGPGDRRECVALLVRGRSRATIILTGHYDTVAIDDYGDLASVATEPDLLAERLVRRLEENATTPAEMRAKADLTSGFLPGRGLLDMKAGLAAGLAVAERFAVMPQEGNILFLAVPDEEASSAGARSAATELAHIAASHDLDPIGAVNLDAIADDGDGSDGRAIALGTIGKFLPTAFVIGQPTHAGFPYAGVNAAVLAAAIARRVEWAPELADGSRGAGTPPSLLSLRDGKAGYDVTTPGTAFATFNVLSVTRTPAEILDAFDALCREAVAELLTELRRRANSAETGPRSIDAIGTVPIIRFEELAATAARTNPEEASQAMRQGAASNLPLPERCRLVTERVWAASGLGGVAVVTGFGSIPYLPTRLSGAPNAQRLEAAAAAAAAEVERRFGTTIRCDEVFAGISDMSFLGEADEASLAVVAANTPVWNVAFHWPEHGGIAGVPIINAGPWGRDYHTPLERLDARYAFDVLPVLIETIVEKTFTAASDAAELGAAERVPSAAARRVRA